MGASLRVCVVDTSASAHRPRPGWLRWIRGGLREEALHAEEAGEELAVVLVAADVRRGFGPGDPGEFLDRLDGRSGVPFEPRVERDDEGATRLASGLQVAFSMASAPGRRPGTIVFFGSGRYTGEDPAPVLAGLQRAGFGFEERAPAPPALGDLALLDILLPPWIEAEAPLGGVARLSYRAGRYPVARAELVLQVAGPSSEKRLRFPLELPPDGGRFEVPLRLGPAGFGRTRVIGEVQLELLGPGGLRFDDPISENDGYEASTRARGELVVAGVARDEDREALERWLAPSGRSSLQGVQWVFEVPAKLGALLEEVDAVIAFDLPTYELPEELLGDFIQRGGGFLATAGWGLLQDWFPGRPAHGLARRLPLEPAAHDTPPREVVLLVDGSGSMEGERFELVRRAALDLVAAALPTDRVTLRFFRTRLGDANLIKDRTETDGVSRTKDVELEAAQAARRLIDLEVPEGSTFVLSSLEHFAGEPYSGEVLALLLSDGEDREGIANLEARTRALHASLREDRRRLVAIAIDARPRATNFLGQLVPAGGRVLEARRLEELQEIFRREVAGSQVRTGDIGVGPRSRTPDSLAYEIELEGGDLPSVERLVQNRPRPGTEVLWESDQGEPVLAVMRSGAGRTAMLSTLPGPGWASSYTDRVGLGEPRLFGALVRWLARRTVFDELELEARILGDEVQVAGFGPQWPLRIEGELVSVFGGEFRGTLVLRPPGPRRAESLVGSDARRVRVGRISPELSRRLDEEELLLRLPGPETTDSSVLLTLPAPRKPGFAHGDRELVRPPVDRAVRDTPRTENPVQAPLGPILLGLGLWLVCVFALLQTR